PSWRTDRPDRQTSRDPEVPQRRVIRLQALGQIGGDGNGRRARGLLARRHVGDERVDLARQAARLDAGGVFISGHPHLRATPGQKRPRAAAQTGEETPGATPARLVVTRLAAVYTAQPVLELGDPAARRAQPVEEVLLVRRRGNSRGCGVRARRVGRCGLLRAKRRCSDERKHGEKVHPVLYEWVGAWVIMSQ